MTGAPRAQAELIVPQPPISDLRVLAPDTDGLPRFIGNPSLKLIAEDKPETPLGEAREVMEYQTGPWRNAVKFFKPWILTPDQWATDRTLEVLQLTWPVFITASNDRFADRICGRTQLIEIINQRAQRLRGKAASYYHYPRMREDLPGCEFALQPANLYNFCRWLPEVALSQGVPITRIREIQAKSETLYRVLQQRYANYRGGLANLINEIFWTASAYLKPDGVKLPSKVFADYPMFGFIPERDRSYRPVDPLFAGKAFSVTELVTPLSKIIEEGYEAAARSMPPELIERAKRATSKGENGQQLAIMFDHLSHYIQEQFPSEYLDALELGLQGLHRLGFVFVDVSPGQIGVDSQRRPIIFDPPSMVRNGSKVHTINLEYAPEWAREAFARGQLYASPQLDLEMLRKIRIGVMTGSLAKGMEAIRKIRQQRQRQRNDRLRQATQRYLDLSED